MAREQDDHPPSIFAGIVEFDENGCPILSERWTFEERLAAVSYLVSKHSGLDGMTSAAIEYICTLPASYLEANNMRGFVSGYAMVSQARDD